MKNTKILIVEDEKIIARDIQSRLEILGYLGTDVVSSGEEAISKSAETRPDLVLMDIKLKGAMDGIEAASHISGQLNIPVVYLTAHSERETLKRAKTTVPYGYILKPLGEKD